MSGKQKPEIPKDKEQEEFLNWRKNTMDDRSLKATEQNMYVGNPTILKEKLSKKPGK
jgi:hypothetical protein